MSALHAEGRKFEPCSVHLAPGAEIKMSTFFFWYITLEVSKSYLVPVRLFVNLPWFCCCRNHILACEVSRDENNLWGGGDSGQGGKRNRLDSPNHDVCYYAVA